MPTGQSGALATVVRAESPLAAGAPEARLPSRSLPQADPTRSCAAACALRLQTRCRWCGCLSHWSGPWRGGGTRRRATEASAAAWPQTCRTATPAQRREEKSCHGCRSRCRRAGSAKTCLVAPGAHVRRHLWARSLCGAACPWNWQTIRCETHWPSRAAVMRRAWRTEWSTAVGGTAPSHRNRKNWPRPAMWLSS